VGGNLFFVCRRRALLYLRSTRSPWDHPEASSEAEKSGTSGAGGELFADDNEHANFHPQTARFKLSK